MKRLSSLPAAVLALALPLPMAFAQAGAAAPQKLDPLVVTAAPLDSAS